MSSLFTGPLFPLLLYSVGVGVCVEWGGRGGGAIYGKDYRDLSFQSFWCSDSGFRCSGYSRKSPQAVNINMFQRD